MKHLLVIFLHVIHLDVIMAPLMYVTAPHTVLIAAKQVTNGSTIEAGYSIGGVIKKRFTADFCEEITIVNLTCPLKPGRLWNYTYQ